MAGAAAVISLVFTMITQLKAFWPSFGRMLDQNLNVIWPNDIPGPYDLAELKVRNLIDDSEYRSYNLRMGIEYSLADKLAKTHERLLDASDYARLFMREKIPAELLIDRLKRIGVRTNDMHYFLQALEYFPSPGDLVRFAVREVYSPEIAEAYGLYEDVPEKYLAEAGKTGMTEEHAKQFWAAHWELPSITMGFEMMHRRIISKDRLKTLLRALDVMPGWRDEMVQLSYTPLTRVDVRRMYGLGVLDREAVYNSYLDIGYSPENAERMTQFTVRYESADADGLTRDSIIESFKRDLITQEELVDLFKKLNYSDSVIQYWIQNAVYEKLMQDIDLYTEDLIDQYMQGLITLDDIRMGLTAASFPSQYIESVVKKVKTQTAKRQKTPSKSELEDWLETGVITEVFYTQKMRLLGYTDEDIQRYLTFMNLKYGTTERRFLKIEKYQQWLYEGIMSDEQFIDTLTAMHTSMEDIMNIIKETKGEDYEV